MVKTTLYCAYCATPLLDDESKKQHMNVYPEHITSGFINKEAGEDGKEHFIASTDSEIEAAKRRINAALDKIHKRIPKEEQVTVTEEEIGAEQQRQIAQLNEQKKQESRGKK